MKTRGECATWSGIHSQGPPGRFSVNPGRNHSACQNDRRRSSRERRRFASSLFGKRRRRSLRKSGLEGKWGLRRARQRPGLSRAHRAKSLRGRSDAPRVQWPRIAVFTASSGSNPALQIGHCLGPRPSGFLLGSRLDELGHCRQGRHELFQQVRRQMCLDQLERLDQERLNLFGLET